VVLHLLLSLPAQHVMFPVWLPHAHLPFKLACPLHDLPSIHAAAFALQQSPVVFASVLSPVSYVDMQLQKLDAASCCVPCLALSQ